MASLVWIVKDPLSLDAYLRIHFWHNVLEAQSRGSVWELPRGVSEMDNLEAHSGTLTLGAQSLTCQSGHLHLMT